MLQPKIPKANWSRLTKISFITWLFACLFFVGWILLWNSNQKVMEKLTWLILSDMALGVLAFCFGILFWLIGSFKKRNPKNSEETKPKTEEDNSFNKFLYIALFGVLIFLTYQVGLNKNLERLDAEREKTRQVEFQLEKFKQSLTPTPTNMSIPKPKVVRINPQVTQRPEPKEWGKAIQIDEHTWTMKVGNDERMGTPREIFEALNNYRQIRGKSRLDWDDRLAAYAQERADYFFKIGNADNHAGFKEYVKSTDNLKKLGFWWVGENSSIGYKMLGVHIIEWIYAGDKPHDDNQLFDWTHVGVGVKGTATDLIFGRDRM